MTIWLLLFMSLGPNNTISKNYFDGAFFNRDTCMGMGRLYIEHLKFAESWQCKEVSINENLIGELE